MESKAGSGEEQQQEKEEDRMLHVFHAVASCISAHVQEPVKVTGETALEAEACPMLSVALVLATTASLPGQVAR